MSSARIAILSDQMTMKLDPDEKLTPTKEKLSDRREARLYRPPEEPGKYLGPTTLIGPEFVLRSSEPVPIVQLAGTKTSTRKRVLVVLLNGSRLEVNCEPSSTTIADIFEIVVRREELDYRVTLGLACLLSGDFVFPPAEEKISKLSTAVGQQQCCRSSLLSVGSSAVTPAVTLYLRFRIYLPSLRGVRSWKWKHLLYLQLRRSLLEKQLRATRAQLLSLAGLALQAEFGDQSSLMKRRGESYFLLEHYLPPEAQEHGGEGPGEAELACLHSRREGLDPGVAEETFICHSASLAEYGTHFISALLVKKEDGSPRQTWVGVNSKGLVLAYKGGSAEAKRQVRQPSLAFTWPQIKKISYSKHYFTITSQDFKYKLKLDSNKSCYLFHLAWLHHNFFMKLSNQLTSLQAIADEFSSSPKKSVLHVSPAPRKPPPEVGALRRAASLLSPDRAIFRGKSATHCQKSNRSESCRVSSTPLSQPSSGHISEVSSGGEEGLNSTGGRRRRPLMGTRAIFTNSQHDLRSNSLEFCCASPISSEPYLLNTNIKWADNKYHGDFHESISQSLAERLEKAAVVNERLLSSVRLKRNPDGRLGLHVSEGKDGHVYVVSTTNGSPAYLSKQIFSGDQIQAVNGVMVLNLPYCEVLRLIETSGTVVELVLSQVDRGQISGLSGNGGGGGPLFGGSSAATSQENGIDIIGVLQKGIEASYLKTIRYDIATEAEPDFVISTDIPRPSSYL